MTELEELVLTPDERARGVRVDGVMFTMDWTGEDHPGQLAEFVAGRVRAFGIPPTGIDTTAVQQTAEADPALRRGDLPVRQLDHLSTVLSGLGCTLAVWDSGTDGYEVLVTRTAGLDPAEPAEPTGLTGLTGLTHEDLPVRAWGTEREETLVSLTCPGCSAMLVWELPPTETLADEHCDCGTPLFDATGRPMPDVTLHD
ncbi:hypothetical protein [Kitasatospora putterlickiae]